MYLHHLTRSVNSAAVLEKDVEMLQFLLSRGADPNRNTNYGGATPLELAAYVSSVPIIETLLDAGAHYQGYKALANAAYYGRVNVITVLLDRGADIDAFPIKRGFYNDHVAMNALGSAAKNGKLAAVELLLERNADVDIRDTMGRSATDLARLHGHTRCAKVLDEYARLKGGK